MPKKRTEVKTAIPTRVPKHGVGLLQVGNPGNVGGAGRPPSEIRAQLRGSFSQRIQTLEEFADGTAYVPIQHRCPECGHQPEETDQEVVPVAVPFSERLRAIDILAKYGLGAAKELSDEVVQAKLLEQILRIRNSFPDDVAEHILSVIKPVWR